MTRPDPTRLDRASYPSTVAVVARFADIDPLWHINNVAIAQYFEEARVCAIRAMAADSRIPVAPEERILIARQTVDYLNEGNYPGSLEVGVGVLRIGTTSFVLGMGLFQSERCIAVSEAVMVLANQRGPMPLPDDYRRRLEAQMLVTERWV
jgi:acyl-CoA thioester hydrolase